MHSIYILWLVVAGHVLTRRRPECHGPKLPRRIRIFWHAVTLTEIFGIMWIYAITCIPIFLSDDATRVRDAISNDDETSFVFVSNWISKRARPDTMSVWERFSPYTIVTPFAACFIKSYINEQLNWRCWMLRLAAELLFPWRTAGLILAILWLLSLGALILTLLQNGLAKSWDFGQLLPTFMVLLPFHTLVAAIAGMFTYL